MSAGHKAGDDGDNKGMEEGDLPKGLPSDLLLSNSPAAQLLLSDKNIVQYANKAAIELLSFAVNHKSSAERLSEFDEGNEIEDPQMQSLSEAPVRRKTTGSRTPRTMGRVKKSTGHGADANNKNPYPPDAKVTSLVGLALTELPMDLAEEETRRWITLEGVLDNIKLSLKKASERAAQDLDDKLGWRKKEDEFYEKFYGNEEASFDWNTHFETGPTPSRKNLRIDTQYLDDILELSEKDTQGTNTMIAKQSIPIKVFRISGRTVTANLYVSVISPGGGGGATLDKAYTSLSLLPMDASFSAQNSDAGKKSGGRTPPSEAAGLTGEAAKVVERVHKLKDLILDEMDYYFMCLSPDGDILITNKATKKLLLGPLAQQVG